jgi:hypothetical protein
MSNNGNCGIQIGSGTGNGSYGYHRYWRYVEGSAVVQHHPRCSRIMLTDINGIDYVIVKYVNDNKADSGTYIIGTVTVDLASRWHDLSISNNSAGLSNGPTYNSNYGGYFSFNGTTQTIPISSILNTYPFTVSFWASHPTSWIPSTAVMHELLNMSKEDERTIQIQKKIKLEKENEHIEKELLRKKFEEEREIERKKIEEESNRFGMFKN